MSQRIVVTLCACALLAAGCGAIADLAGAPNPGVTSVTVVLPATILVGDTVQAGVTLLNGKGKPPIGDSTVTWRSSDPASVSVDAGGRVVGSAPGVHATISATVGKVTGSLAVSVADDQRLGYALANQPAAAGPYAPDPAYSFNSSGNPIQVTRASAGSYSVRFGGLGRSSGQRDNVQVTGSGGAAGVFCKLAGWQSAGADLTADVLCFTPAGAPTDSRFTILLSGARVYNPNSRLGFALSPDLAANAAGQVDTSGTTRNNSATQRVLFGHGAPGQYAVTFPGLERVASGTPTQGPETVQVTAVGGGPERCQVVAVDAPHAGVGVTCTTTGGAASDARFSILWIQRGRQGLRFGYALADKPGSSTEYSTIAYYTRNPGGDVTARLLATGQYRVTFQGIARSPGDTDTILLTPFSAGAICTTTASANSGADYAVTLACFNGSGAPVNTTFDILLIQ